MKDEIFYTIGFIFYRLAMITMILLWDLPGQYWFWYFALCALLMYLQSKPHDTKGVTNE